MDNTLLGFRIAHNKLSLIRLPRGEAIGKMAQRSTSVKDDDANVKTVSSLAPLALI